MEAQSSHISHQLTPTPARLTSGKYYTGNAICRYPSYLANSKSVKNHKDKEYSGQCLQVIGHGDGGGGPNEAMIERIKRMGNLDGLPNVSFGDPNDFFSNVRNECKEITEWKGELVSDIVYNDPSN